MASKKRIHRPRQQTPEQEAHEAKLRAEFQQAKPSLTELAASSEYTEPMNNGQYRQVMATMAKLKAVREEASKSLRDIAAAAGIDHAALSRLENGVTANPTFNTVFRYAQALGKQIRLTVVDAEDPPALAGN